MNLYNNGRCVEHKIPYPCPDCVTTRLKECEIKLEANKDSSNNWVRIIALQHELDDVREESAKNLQAYNDKCIEFADETLRYYNVLNECYKLRALVVELKNTLFKIQCRNYITQSIIAEQFASSDKILGDK